MSGTDYDTIRSNISKMITRVEITREARFVANKRLSRRHRQAYYVISLLSLFVILVSVIPNIYENLARAQTQLLLAISIVNSVFIIITTMMDSARGYDLRAYHHQKCARRLSGVLNSLYNLATKDEPTAKQVTALHDEYQKILDDCPFDHDEMDFWAVQSKRPDLFPKVYKSDAHGSLSFWSHLKVYQQFYRVCYARMRWSIPHLVVVIASVVLMFAFREIPYIPPGS